MRLPHSVLVLACLAFAPLVHSQAAGLTHAFDDICDFCTGRDVAVTCDRTVAPGNCSDVSQADYYINAELTMCAECPEGTMSFDLGLSCNPCEDGTYRNASMTTCEPCPAGKFAVTNGDGHYASCDLCPAGTVSGGGGFEPSGCQSCTTGVADDARTACLACGDNQEQTSNTCSNCTDGEFSVAGGTCQACLDGTIGAGEANGCDLATTGKFINAGVAEDAASGRWMPGSGMRSSNDDGLQCPPGHISVKDHQAFAPSEFPGGCAPCIVFISSLDFTRLGFVPKSTQDECGFCPDNGVYATHGMPECLACPAGRYSQHLPNTLTEFGGGICDLGCPVGTSTADVHYYGKVFDGGATPLSVCNECPPGTVGDPFDPYITACRTCDPNTYQTAGDGLGRRCEACPAGSESPAGASAVGHCTGCDLGRFGHSPGQGCGDCWAGSAQNDTGQTTCKECTPGYFTPNEYGARETCVACPVGKHSTGYGATACSTCPPGRYQDEEGKAVCKIATAGSVPSSPERDALVACTRGNYTWEDGLDSCAPCPAGRFQGLDGQTFCEACAVGTYGAQSRADTSLCPPCERGEYAPAEGYAVCLPCPVGYHGQADGNTRGICDPCDAGKYSNATAGSHTCTDCHPGFFSAVTALSTCEPCPAGLVAETGGLTACVGCAADSATSGGLHSTGASTCSPCSDDTVVDITGQQECYTCPDLLFKSTSGSCTATCPDGAVVLKDDTLGTTSCSFCDAGSVLVTETCEACPTGLYQSSTICVPCPDGSVAPGAGTFTCTSCLQGDGDVQRNSTHCAGCPAGTYAAQNDAVDCTQCSGNTFAAASASVCTDCTPGRVTDGGTCVACPEGTFHAAQADIVCTNCVAGLFAAASAGKTQCDVCPLGYASTKAGETACEVCESGFASFASRPPSHPVGSTYVVEVMNVNGGGEEASAVTLTDTLADGVQFVNADGDGWNCTHDGSDTGGVVSCAMDGTVPAGASAATRVAITVASGACAATDDVLTVSSSCEGSTTANNVATLSAAVSALDLHVSATPAQAVAVRSPSDAGLGYTFTVAADTDAAPGVVFTYLVPTGLTLVSTAVPAGLGCTQDVANQGAFVSCTLNDTLPAGASFDVAVTLDVDATGCGDLTHVATVATTACDGTPANDQVSTVETVDATDVFLEVAAVPGEVQPGTLTPSTGVVLVVGATGSVDVPALDINLAVGGASPPVFEFLAGASGCDAVFGTLCVVTNLAPGSPRVLVANVTAPAASCGVFSATAAVEHNNTAAGTGAVFPCDGNNANNVATFSTVTTVADLAVDIAQGGTIDPAGVAPNSTATLEYTITNSGPFATATGVQLTVVLPSGTLAGDVTGCVATTSTADGFECSVVDVGVGSPAVVTADVFVEATTCGDLLFQADVDTDACDGNSTSNDAELVLGTASPALTLGLVTNSPSADRGDTRTLTLTVTNSGAADADGVEVTIFPDAATYDSDDCGVASTQPAGGGVSCAVGTIASGASTTFTVTVTVDATACGTLTHTSAAAWASCDGTMVPDAATATTTVGVAAAMPDMALAVSAGAAYVLDVDNLGHDNATGVVVSAVLDASVTYVVASGGDWSCAFNGADTVDCGLGVDLGPLSVAPELIVGVEVSGTPCPGVSDTITVTAAGDCDATNDAAAAFTAIPGADLSIAVTDNVPASGAVHGSTYTYTVSVSNAGPLAATDTDITVEVDPLATLQSITSLSGTCNSGVCSLASLAAGGTFVVEANVQAEAAACGSVTHVFNVTSATCDGDDSNFEASVVSPVQTADVGLVLESSPSANVAPGDAVTVSATVRNVGAVEYTSADVTLTAPAGLDNANMTGCSSVFNLGSVWTCTVALAPLTVESRGVIIDVVTSQDRVGVVALTGTVAADACHSLLTTASVSAACDDNPDNDAATVSTGVLATTSTDLTLPTAEASATQISASILNSGTTPASTVVTSFVLGAGVKFVDDGGLTGCSYTAGTRTWACALTADLPAGFPLTLAANVEQEPGVCGPYDTTVTITSDTCDSNPDNDAVVITSAFPAPDLAMHFALAPGVAVAAAGDVLDYNATVVNAGLAAASDTVVDVVLDAHHTLHADSTTAGWTSSVVGNATVASYALGAVAAATQVEAPTLRLEVAPSACTDVTAAATASTSDCDTDTSDNGASVTTLLLSVDVRVQVASGVIAALTACEACEGNTFSDPGSRTCTQCPRGEVTDNQERCRACSTGTYHADVADTFCTACTSGFFAGGEGQSVCTSCASGTFSFTTVVGRTVCTDCPLGRASAAAETVACTPCEELGNNTYTPEVGATECVLCPEGSVVDGVVCSPCDTGRYHPAANATECVVCPQGRATDAAGTFGECPLCLAGFTASDEEQVTCDECTAGLYAPVDGMDACLSCGANNTVSLGAQAAECTPCDAGFVATEGLASTCVACSPGLFHTTPNATACTECPLGRFAADANATECALCPSGLFASFTGSSACDACETGTFFSDVGASVCLACPNNTIAPNVSTVECVACAGGSIRNDRFTECQLCEENTYHPNSTATVCLQCPIGQFASAEGSTQCGDCPAGTAYQDAVCVDCPEGTFQNQEGQLDCKSCTGNTVSGNAAPICNSCPHGQVAADTRAVCEGVPRGKFHAHVNDTEGTPCPGGSYTDETGLTECKLCEPGLAVAASDNGVSTCAQCSRGFYAPRSNMTACIDCDGNSIAATSGLSVCSNCTFGERVTSETGKQGCLACPIGTFHANATNTFCTKCTPGTAYNNQTTPALEQCTPCALGRFQAQEGQFTCDSCTPEQYTPDVGQTTCISCNGDDVPNTIPFNSLSCSKCPNGTIAADDKCLECPAGEFHAHTDDRTCTTCPDTGRFAPTNGTFGECPACPPGFYNAEPGQTVCSACESGLYMEDYGATACIRCNSTLGDLTSPFIRNDIPNKDSNATACVLCPPGSLSESLSATGVESLVCVECPVGRYHKSPEDVECTACETGRFSNTTGQTNCTECPAGRSALNSAGSGNTFCEDCTPGKFQGFSDKGFPECQTCPGNSFQPNTSATSCEQCLEPTLQDAHLGCKVCDFEKREFQVINEELQLFTCASCQTNFTYVVRTGTEVPSDVESSRSVGAVEDVLTFFSGDIGFTINSDVNSDNVWNLTSGRPPCSLCGPGFFFSQNNPTECQQCPAGFIAPESGATVCLDCNTVNPPIQDDGTTGVWFNAISSSNYTVCEVCPAGFFMKDRLECERCAVGARSDQDADRCITCTTREFENGNNTECIECTSDGLNCAEPRLDIRQGFFWDASEPIGADTELYECFNVDACITSGNASIQSVTCRQGHNGTLCANCIDGYSLSPTSKLCQECTDTSQQLAVVFLALIGVSVAAVFFVYRNGTTEDTSSEVTPLFRILVNFANTATLLSALEIRMPSLAETITDALFQSDPSGAVVAPAKCLGGWTFKHELYIYVFLMPALVVISKFIAWLFTLCHSAWSTAHVLLVLYFLVFNRLATVLFTVFDLYPVEIEYGGRTDRYLRADFTVSENPVETPPFYFQYAFMVNVAAACLVAYVIFPPAATIWYLNKRKGLLNNDAMRPFRFIYMGYSLGPDVFGAPKEDAGRAFKCYCCCRGHRQCWDYRSSTHSAESRRKYGAERWFWEFWNMFRKILVLAVVSLNFIASEEFLQLFLAVLLLGIFLGMHLTFSPYEHAVCDVAETVALASLLLNQGLTLLYHLYEDPLNEPAQQSVQALSFVVTIITYLVLLLVVVHFATEGTKCYFLTRVCKCIPESWRAPRFRKNQKEEQSAGPGADVMNTMR